MDSCKCTKMPKGASGSKLCKVWLCLYVLLRPEAMHQGSYTPGRLRTWEATHLGGYAPGRLHTWEATHLGSYAPGKLHTWEATHLGGYTPGKLCTWEATHLGSYAPGRLGIWKLRIREAHSWRLCCASGGEWGGLCLEICTFQKGTSSRQTLPKRSMQAIQT